MRKAIATDRPPVREALFWVPLALLAALMFRELLTRVAALPPEFAEFVTDISIYREAGEAILGGALPYRDFFIEYPPGGLPAFILPAVLSESTSGYLAAFTFEMALALAAALVLTALAARRLDGLRAYPVPALTFALGAVMLYPVALTRYDALVTLSLALAALCVAYGGRLIYLAYFALGLGAAAKLVPALVVLPLAFLRGRGAALRGGVAFGGALALFFVPALLLGGERLAESFAYHAERGVQVESLWSSAMMQLGWVEEIVFRYGAFEVQGPGTGLAASLSLPVTGALLLVTALALYREHRAGRFGAARFPAFAAALILAFMLGSKVVSPQYMIWLLPLLPLSFTGLTGAGVSLIFLAACWTTAQVFPFNYDSLLSLQPPGTYLLLGRNLLLILLWALLLFLPAESSTDREKP